MFASALYCVDHIWTTFTFFGDLIQMVLVTPILLMTPKLVYSVVRAHTCEHSMHWVLKCQHENHAFTIPYTPFRQKSYSTFSSYRVVTLVPSMFWFPYYVVRATVYGINLLDQDVGEFI